MSTHKANFAYLFIVLMIVFGCSGNKEVTSSVAMLDQYRDAIVSEVEDAGRRSRVLDIVDNLKIELSQWKAGEEKYKAKFKALNAYYDTTEAVLRAHIDKWNDTRSEFRKKVYKARDGALEILTRDEWRVISDREASFVEVWLRESLAL